MEALLLDGVAVEVGERDVVGRDLDDLAVADLERLAGVRDERGDVGGEEVLALADADDQRRVAAGGDDAVGGVGVHGEQRERAVEAAADRAHGVDQVGPGGDLGGQQVRDDLGVGLGGEPDAGVLQLGAEPGEVLDDAVVDDGDPAGLVEVRVGVTVGGRAVRGPPGVTSPVPDTGSGRSSSAFSRFTSFPARLAEASAPSATTATPAES